jgi:hypothetical protein
MSPGTVNALAIHICADIATAGPDKHWPYSIAAQDTVRRAARICQRAGIVEQTTLAGEHATTTAVVHALLRASAVLAHDGLLVLTFSGHTRRGEGPLDTARWCLFDGGLELSQITCQLALFPEAARLVIICDTCYAAAIAATLVGAQRVLVLASCSKDQTMVERVSSEFMVRLERFICSDRNHGSLEDLRVRLESDTPDCERPAVWTNTVSWWSAKPIEMLITRVCASSSSIAARYRSDRR